MSRKYRPMKNPVVRRLSWVALAGVFLAASVARGADYKKGPNEFSFHIGGQADWVGWAPGGAKLFLEYARYLRGKMWLDFQLNPIFGHTHDEHCHWDPHDEHWHCDYWHGSGLELFGGVKWKFNPFKVPFVPYVRVGGAVIFISYPHDIFGFGLAARGGGGFKFFVLKNFGIGMEANMAVGFSVLNEHVGFQLYLAFDIGIGLEVLF